MEAITFEAAVAILCTVACLVLSALALREGILANKALKKDDCDALAVYNRQFHSKLEHISDKRRILNVIDSQEEYIIRFSAIAISNYAHREQAHQEHHRMVDLIEQRDLPGLVSLMQSHLEESKQTCLYALRAKEHERAEQQ